MICLWHRNFERIWFVMHDRKYFRKRPIRSSSLRSKRRLLVEMLEDRRLLNVDWRNPLDSMDVDNDGNLSPLDALSAINYINANVDRSLPPVRPVNQPYYDIDGDLSVSPLDVLAVINQINSRGTGARVLKETTNALVQESNVVITLGQAVGTRSYRMKIEPKFDTTDRSSILEDLVAVYLVDPSNPTNTLLDRGTGGTAIFTLSGTKAEFATGRVQWDGSILQIDLSDFATKDTAILKLQLLNNDGDSQTSVTFQPIANEINSRGSLAAIYTETSTLVSPGAGLNLAGLTEENRATVQASNVRYAENLKRYEAELRVATQQFSIGRNVAVAFPGLPAGVTLRNASGTTARGEPYINIKSAIPNGGLSQNSWSNAVSVQFDNPQQIPFSLKPKVFADANRGPTIGTIAPITVQPGGFFNLAIPATDADGDVITYDIRSSNPLPKSTLRGNGVLEIRPTAEQIGRYVFDVVVSDGAVQASQTVTLDVIADSNTTTRVSGKILKVDGQPLANIRVEIGSVQGLTTSDGSFELNLGTGVVVSDTLKVRGELFIAGGKSYPFIAEKIAFMLERDVIKHVNNRIVRPIYLPSIDLANAVQVDPTRDTLITTGAISGASVLVKAGNLIDLQGTPYSGKLSITEVPVTLTPAALPRNLIPDLVVTIQPGDMVFAAPAPLSLPNRSGRTAGSVLDLWSISPITGEFTIVGGMVVSADGKTVDTISGGIRFSSWHFVVEPSNQPGPIEESRKFKQGCEEEKKTCRINSEVETYTGAVIESHELASYQSQGQSRRLTMVYDSLRADPRPIVHFRYRRVETGPNIRLVAGVSISRGDYSHTFSRLDGTGENGGSVYADNFWSIPASGGTVDAALQLDMKNTSSGSYQYALSSGVARIFEPQGGFGGELGLSGSIADETGTIVNVNTIDSPFGAGWGLAGLQQLIENPDGSVLLVDGDGSELLYGPGLVSLPGDFSTLAKGADGLYTRTLKDQTVFAFDTKFRLQSETDRNGNRTTYTYDAMGKLITITDPVGLQTVFRYVNNRLQSITDPAGRVTEFVLDAAGNLIQVKDPDSRTRNWQYDGEHHQVVEINKLGQREETYFDFAGRARGSKRADGTEIKISPAQVKGLYPNTRDMKNSPLAVNIGEAVSQYVTSTGNVVTSVLDKFGQVVSERDSVGPLPTYAWTPNNQVSSIQDTRGNETLFKYDAKGNLVSSEDSLSVKGVVVGEISQPGERHIYTFAGSAGQQILIDGHSEPDPLGRSAIIKLMGPDGQTIVTILATSDTSSILLKLNGLYRIEVVFPLSNDEAAPRGISGPYQFKLINLSDSTSAEYNKSVPIKVPAFQLVAWQFEGVAGQRITPTFDYFASLKMSVYSPDNQRIQTNFDTSFTLPLTGKYVLTAGNSSSENIKSSFKLSVLEPPSSPLIGLDEVHSGTAAAGQIVTFDFSGPAGLPVTYEQISTGNFFVGFRHLETSEELQCQGRVVPLPHSGRYSVIINNFSTEPFDFSFQMLNMGTPNRRLQPGVARNLSLKPSAQTSFSFQGTVGERVILNESPLESKITFLHGTTVEQNYYAGARLPATGTYYVILRNLTSATVDTKVAKFDIQTRTLNLDTEVTGTLPAEGAPHIYQFEGRVGQNLYFDDLGSTPGGAWVLLNPDGDAVASNSGFAFGNRLGEDNVGVLKATGTYHLLLSSRENNANVQSIAHNYHFRLLNSVTSVRSLTLGQVVSGTIDRKNDSDEYTFQGTAGQRLFFDGLTRSSSLKVDIITPSGTARYGKGNIFGPGPGNDIASITLLETGTYRFTVFGDYVFNHFTGDYQFRLLDVASLPPLNIGGTTSGTSSPQLVASAHTFTGRRGQSLHFQLSGDPNTVGSVRLNLYGPEDQYLFAIGNDSTKLLPSDGTYVLSNLYDQTEGQPPIAYSLQTTDVSDSPIAPSGLNGLFTGNIGAGETKTYQFNAPAGLVVLFDNHSVEDVGLQAAITYPSVPTAVEVAVFGVGRDHSTPISLPRSGTYTITVRGNNATVSGSYEFRIVDILHDSIPVLLDSLVQGTFEANKKGSHVYRFVTAPGQAFYVDQTNNDWNYIVRSPDQIRQASQPTIALAGTQYLIASRNNTNGLGYSFRIVNLESVPELVLVEAVEGVASPGRAVIYKAEAKAGDRLVYEIFNSQLVVVYDRSMGQFGSRSVQTSEFVANHDGTYWFVRDNDYIRDPFPFKIRLTFPETVTKELDNRWGSSNVEKIVYDPVFNKPIRHQDALGRTTTWDLDPTTGNALVSTRVVGEPGGLDDVVTRLTYTPRGLVDTVIDARGVITDMDYDPLGRLILITDAKGTPLQTTYRLEYDTAGNAIGETDENGHRTVFQYDAMNRLTQVTSPDPDGTGPLAASVAKLKFDAIGNMIESTDPLGHVNRTIYDPMQRVTEEIDAIGNRTQYKYDVAGNLIRVINPLGHDSKTQYDVRNRVVAQIDAAGGRTALQYDADNNLTALTDASGNTTRYEYDARNRVTKRMDPLNATKSFEYNVANDLVKQTDRLGRIVETTFDDLDRLSTEVWRNPNGSLANTVNYTYDAASNLVRLKDSVSDLQFTWDVLNRATREAVSGPNGLPTSVLDNTFDAVGNRVTVADTINGQAGGLNTFSYDALDRMTRIVQTGISVSNKRVDMQYNALGQMTALARFADTAGAAPVAATTYVFDTLNRISSITHRNTANTVLDSFAYQYDAASRITRITDIDGATDYVYDTRDQLTGANHADAANPDETYAYDSTGNRTTSQRHGTGYVVGDGIAGTPDNNRLTSDGTYRYSYDAEGNLTTRMHIASGEVREFSWDHRNRLVRVSDRLSAVSATTQVVEYTYDAFNRRIAMKVDKTPADAVDGTVTYFINDGDDVLADWTDPDGSGPASAVESIRYLHGPDVDQVLAQEDESGNVLWHLTDHLGSVRDLINSQGQIVNHLKYDSYGNVISQLNPAANTRHRYTGREFDTEVGMHYNRARYYDGAVGRFLSEDPIGFASGDTNQYRYVSNSPIDATDRFGTARNRTNAEQTAGGNIVIDGKDVSKTADNANSRNNLPQQLINSDDPAEVGASFNASLDGKPNGKTGRPNSSCSMSELQELTFLEKMVLRYHPDAAKRAKGKKDLADYYRSVRSLKPVQPAERKS